MTVESKASTTLVLAEIVPGKKYLTGTKGVTQPSQKENTCWFYAFNLIRPRIGKLNKLTPAATPIASPTPDEKIETKEDPDMAALLQKRHVEQTISAYRKARTALDERISKEINLAKEANTKELAGPMLANYKNYYTILLAASTRKDLDGSLLFLLMSIPDPIKKMSLADIKNNIDFLESFIQQSRQATLASFIQARSFENEATNVKLTMRRLGRDYAGELTKQMLSSSHSSSEEKELSLDDKSILLNGLMVRVAAEEYHLKASTWNPADGFIGLSNAIKKEGALAVSATLGLHIYQEKSKTKGEKAGPYQIHFWPKGATKRPKITAAHEIVVVGTEQISTGKGLQETVLFADPNDESKPGKARKIYRVSYDTFCRNIMNNTGTHLINNLLRGTRVPGPFAYCANPEYQLETAQQYARVSARSKAA